MINVFIGVGSNISPETNIVKAFDILNKHVAVTGISTFYRTKPLAGKDQEDYLNGVWRIQTTVSPGELKFSILSSIEEDLHRIRTHDKYASRTIDLDVLLFGDLILRETNFIIPDPDIYIRAFIAFPLFELEPNMILPDTKIPIRSVADTLSEETILPDVKFTELIKRRNSE